MHEDCARLLKFQGASTWLWAVLLLTATVSCKQDWNVPIPSQGLDGGSVTDEAASDAATSSKSQVGGKNKDSGQLLEEQRSGESSGSGSGGAGGKGGSAAPASGGSGGQANAPDTSAAHGGSPAAGNGNAGSDAGTQTAMPAQEPCTTQGSMRCVGTGPGGQREVCQGGVFRAAAACGTDEVCDDERGECVKVAAICQGSAGKNVCDGKGGLVSCAANGSVRAQESCMSERHCQVGIATGHCPTCIPGEYRCDGAKLDQCDKDGQAFQLAMMCDSAALCKAESGACTDAACAAGRFSCMRDTLMQCNADQTGFDRAGECQPGLCDATRGECLACSPSSRSCDTDGSTALICSSAGELSRSACAGSRPHCVGAGQCVECSVASPCPQSNDVCKTSSCNVRTGSCESTRVNPGTGCSLAGKSGVCDSAGACVECLSEGDGHCAGASPHCTTAHTCARCLQDSHCGFGEKCVNASCIAKCGDGVLDPGEDCERGYLNSSASNCDFKTCKRTNYMTCRDTAVMCPASNPCLAGFYCVPTSDKQCLTSCPEVPGMKTGCAQGICYLDCTNGGKCPSDMTCTHASPDGTTTTDMCFGK